MTKISWPAGTLLAPVPPALISSGTLENPNVMTAAWTGIVCSDPAMTYVSLRPSRYSHEIISKSGEFVINVPNLPLAKAVDFCGVKSGRNTDKFQACGITAAPSSKIKAPQVKEAPISLECKVRSITHYGTHDMFLADIVAVNVDDAYINKQGGLNLEKAGLLAYAHGFYYTLGRQLGKFGFSVEKAKTIKKRRRMQHSVATKGDKRK
ncbi:MAG: flavin reductase family protein [Alphaproteobacteria bacterium]|nr:flavin reductase family protein [Alphaproteobacteria bacterium]